ncbi:hypothetical protein L313_2810 [Acinetobacter haemolyticus CIP 64.3 = MTCC 9819]|uniref:Uncharacterized protein n=1 Tax=Acinetobacter haemolyticus CIP 64.3 = MTCC 9819 TaxID=1217659 RepID=N9EZD7_ACIHA|nr:hypothetical protein [Acinetobacter haemolyticus]ENW15627.1 hypothetical protein F927_03367 [Acinetobacter haemolyticus CIP 64.3 = MTCC 9819]EPR90400.1 hypothetical protein L313_2810 [Acinetobacter haemolyticus CIP 64.3 = MTCC 9819]QXZ26461.1 hypothetical protein I6L22_15025 [Acinetobacter haemolyticus]SPT48650.1 Uncharacterised protein [Acinetobacter haemolyticus]SUU61778.1 Uncharacterised protein [Acinetobacter haemolyticus]
MCKGGAISSSLEAVQGFSNAVTAEAVAKGNAKTVQSMARLNAAKIKDQGRKNASSARAAAAENGLDVNVGVPTVFEDEHLADAAYNASMTEQDATNQARQIRRQGSQQRNNYGLKATSSVIDTFAQAYGGWK